MKLSFNLEDAGQVVVGSFVLAVPISFSEEAWRMGETLPLVNLFVLFSLSISFLTIFAYTSVFQSNVYKRVPVLISRVFIAYFITVIVVALVLWSLNKFPILSETEIAIKRLIIIAMPASMGAIIVDSFDKE